MRHNKFVSNYGQFGLCWTILDSRVDRLCKERRGQTSIFILYSMKIIALVNYILASLFYIYLCRNYLTFLQSSISLYLLSVLFDALSFRQKCLGCPTSPMRQRRYSKTGQLFSGPFSRFMTQALKDFLSGGGGGEKRKWGGRVPRQFRM